MNLSHLLATRQSLLEQARLANTAFAYVTLKRLADVVQRARLGGPVRLRQPNESEEHYWATLEPMLGSQSVIDEQFSDEDIADMADAVAFVLGTCNLDLTFPLEELQVRFARPLLEVLERAGVAGVDSAPATSLDPARRYSPGG